MKDNQICQFSFLLIKEQQLLAMSIVQLHSELTSIPRPRKVSKIEKEAKLKDERDKLSDMVDLFYSKAKNKIQKTLSKDNKKATLLCKELLGELSLSPKQQIYEISRLSDQFFNEMTKLNIFISDFLKSIESLNDKIAKELTVQKQKVTAKQQKEALGEYQIAILRKINFKKQKTSLSLKLKDIDTLNKKLVKFQNHPEEEQSISSIEIDGKKVQIQVYKYRKIHFQCKKREYLLCICRKKQTEDGQLAIYSDKLQLITSFNHLPPINLRTFLDIIPIDNYLFIVHTHQIIRISLTNELESTSQLFRQRINKVDSLGGELVVWLEDIIFMNSNLEIHYQEYLRINVKSIGIHFKICTEDSHELYFLARTSTGTSDLFKIKDINIELIIKDFGSMDQAVECKCSGKVDCALLRRNGELFKFTSSNLKEKMIQIDLDNGQSMKKCCILGQHLYALHQSGKQMLQCHFRLNIDEENPQP